MAGALQMRGREPRDAVVDKEATAWGAYSLVGQDCLEVQCNEKKLEGWKPMCDII